MKNLSYPFILILFTLASCFGSKDYLVESDYSYAGNFKKYKTYSFIDQQRLDSDSVIPEELIMKTIKNRMSLLGYKHSENKPNLLIGFRMYYDDFMFNGWKQPQIEIWLEEHGFVEEEFDKVKYRLHEGTLMILFVDRRMNKTVWQGYNSGLIDLNSIENERFIKGSVRLIFDKYRVFAQGYLKERS
jgi:hypothetical protein